MLLFLFNRSHDSNKTDFNRLPSEQKANYLIQLNEPNEKGEPVD